MADARYFQGLKVRWRGHILGFDERGSRSIIARVKVRGQDRRGLNEPVRLVFKDAAATQARYFRDGQFIEFDAVIESQGGKYLAWHKLKVLRACASDPSQEASDGEEMEPEEDDDEDEDDEDEDEDETSSSDSSSSSDDSSPSESVQGSEEERFEKTLTTQSYKLFVISVAAANHFDFCCSSRRKW